MLQRAIKTMLVVLVLGFGAHEANAFGRWGCGWGGGCGYAYGGYGGCGWGGCGYGGYAYGGYGGWGYGGYPYVGYAANSSQQLSNVGLVTAGPAGAVDAYSVMLTLSVPADAKVIINGYTTTSTGAQRKYVSKGLDAASSYTYQVHAEFTRDGQPVTEERTVKLVAGQSSSLAFGVATQPVVANVAQSAQR